MTADDIRKQLIYDFGLGDEGESILDRIPDSELIGWRCPIVGMDQPTKEDVIALLKRYKETT